MRRLALRSSALQIAALSAAVGSIALAAPSVAGAAGCQGAPGTSALEQYCEAIPDATGGRQNPGSSAQNRPASGTSASGKSGSGVSKRTASALAAAGADGAAVEKLAGGAAKTKTSAKKKSKASTKVAVKEKKAGTSGSSSGTAAASVSVSTGTTPVAEPADPSNSPLKATTNAVSGGPTVGGGFVWGLLGMSVFGAAAAVLLRRNRHTLDPSADE